MGDCSLKYRNPIKALATGTALSDCKRSAENKIADLVVPEHEWLPTPAATTALGYSARTLKRYRDRNGGFLIAGEDWCFGPTGASSISWNITTCRQKFHERGRLMLAIDAERKQLAGVN